MPGECTAGRVNQHTASAGLSANDVGRVSIYQDYLLYQGYLLCMVVLMTAVAVDVDLSVAAGRLFKVLGDPTRLALLRHLAEGAASVGQLVEAVNSPSQSRVSNHLACLRWCGLVTSEKLGRSVIYRLADASVLSLLDLACDVAAPHAEHLATCTRIGPDWV